MNTNILLFSSLAPFCSLLILPPFSRAEFILYSLISFTALKIEY